MKLWIEEIAKHHNRRAFDCGQRDLNQYLSHTARQHTSRHLSKTFVLIEESDPSSILGYYSLVTCEVEAPINSKLYQKYPHPLPAIKLARLAVDLSQQGQGYGGHLLISAIRNTARIAAMVGVIGLFADAKDKRARNFYQPFGFDAIADNDLHLWLPIGRCQQLAL